MKTYPYPARQEHSEVGFHRLAEDHISDENLMILDVQPNVHDYIMGHLPGPVYLNEGLLRSAQERAAGRVCSA